MRDPVKSGANESRWTGRIRLLSISLAAFWGFYFVCSPYNFLDPRGREWTFKPVNQLIERGSGIVRGAEQAGPTDVWRFERGKGDALNGVADYVVQLASVEGLGLVTTVLGLVGLVGVLASGKRGHLVFAGYAIAFALTSACIYPGRALPRHQCPLYPFLAVAGGLLVVQICGRLNRQAWLAYTVLLLVLCIPLTRITQRALELTKEDTRNVARSWIESNLPADSKLLMDENGPPLLFNEKRLDVMFKLASQADSRGQFTAHYDTLLKYKRSAAQQRKAYEVYEIRIPWWLPSFEEQGTHLLETDWDRDHANPLKPVGVENFDDYAGNGFDYAVVHSDIYRGFLDTRATKSRRFPAFQRFYRELFRRGVLLKSERNTL